jgi:hypothetical protein
LKIRWNADKQERKNMVSQANSLNSSKAENFFDRHAWIILLGVALLTGIFGVGDMIGGASDLQNGETVLMHSIAGTSWNELKTASSAAANLIDWKFKSEGASLFTLALLTMAICLGGFRRGQRWAWYALCAIPLWLVLGAINILVTIRHPEYGTPVPYHLGGDLFRCLGDNARVVFSQVLSTTAQF